MFNYFSELEALQYLDMDNRPPRHWAENRSVLGTFRQRARNFLRIMNFLRITRRAR